MKIGVNFSINVTKLDKSRFIQGKNGKYVNLTGFIDTDNPGQYGDHGTLSQSVTSEELKNGTRLPICGNCKVFWTDSGADNRQAQQRKCDGNSQDQPYYSDDIPF